MIVVISNALRIGKETYLILQPVNTATSTVLPELAFLNVNKRYSLENLCALIIDDWTTMENIARS